MKPGKLQRSKQMLEGPRQCTIFLFLRSHDKFNMPLVTLFIGCQEARTYTNKKMTILAYVHLVYMYTTQVNNAFRAFRLATQTIHLRAKTMASHEFLPNLSQNKITVWG